MALIISKDTVWRSGETITLTEDVQIANGATLTIKPGAKVDGNGYEILTFGTLLAGQRGSEEAVKFSNANFQFGNDHSDPGRIEIYNSEIAGGSFLAPSGRASYGSFDVRGSFFNGVDGFYIWYPQSDSRFEGNLFQNSDGIDIGTRFPVTLENNAFYGASPAYSDEGIIVSWASYGAEDHIRVVDNAFYGKSMVMSVRDGGYTSAYMYANGNYIDAANDKSGEKFVLDNQDSLTRWSDIDLRDEASEHQKDTPKIVFGTEQGDLIRGSSGLDRLFGGAGDDTLIGFRGNDLILGGTGRDKIKAGAGGDRIDAGKGKDVVFGGAGNDDFIFADKYGTTRIKDFDANSNREDIDVSAVSAIRGLRDLKKNHMEQSGDNVVIDDNNGTKIILQDTDLADLGKGDFIF